MRKVNFDRLKEGDLVQVPTYQFAPMRRGWNGWLFSKAVVIRKGIGKKSGKPVVILEVMRDAPHNKYTTSQQSFFADCVFEADCIDNAKHFLEQYNIKSKEQYDEWIAGDNVTGAHWITFLIDKGFIFEHGENENEGI